MAATGEPAIGRGHILFLWPPEDGDESSVPLVARVDDSIDWSQPLEDVLDEFEDRDIAPYELHSIVPYKGRLLVVLRGLDRFAGQPTGSVSS